MRACGAHLYCSAALPDLPALRSHHLPPHLLCPTLPALPPLLPSAPCLLHCLADVVYHTLCLPDSFCLCFTHAVGFPHTCPGCAWVVCCLVPLPACTPGLGWDDPAAHTPDSPFPHFCLPSPPLYKVPSFSLPLTPVSHLFTCLACIHLHTYLCPVFPFTLPPFPSFCLLPLFIYLHGTTHLHLIGW